MGKCNLSITAYMFRSQFKLSKAQLAGLERLCLFVVRVYIHSWFTSQVPAWAPANTLQFVRAITSYEDEKISETAGAAIGRHLWYISELLVMMALFDERLPNAEKAAMARAVNPGNGWPLPRVPLTRGLTIKDVGQRRLADFVTTESLGFFDITGIRRDFLAKDPQDWPTDESWTEGKKLVDGLRVVNDCAERGVALIKDYITNPLTRDEEQLQLLLKVVKDHRERLPTLNRKHEILNL
ncbi:uncharacterized protein LOC117644065 [Thrips palmi]|uniref:Uncharacterized protein LOC117644065 n=1 Tax=Thrips palmi TaxID=161013 RepID=A0A6P8YY25_THRPL|nr:uncharacterized protein LOC117644065 [Thrips palmi]